MVECVLKRLFFWLGCIIRQPWNAFRAVCCGVLYCISSGNALKWGFSGIGGFWCSAKWQGSLLNNNHTWLYLMSSLPSGCAHWNAWLILSYWQRKTTIVVTWKTPLVYFRRLKHKISWIMKHKKIAGIINDQSARFEWNWEPWASYIHVPLSLTPGAMRTPSSSSPNIFSSPS